VQSLHKRPAYGSQVEQKTERCIATRIVLDGVIELSRMSRKGRRPDIGERAQSRLMDSNPPVAALLAAFNKHDAIEGCFNEECQGMLECPPEPNVILPFRTDDEKTLGGAGNVCRPGYPAGIGPSSHVRASGLVDTSPASHSLLRGA
jgi:hypothetical protein